jgi:rhodanese-related sulfurtransferase
MKLGVSLILAALTLLLAGLTTGCNSNEMAVRSVSAQQQTKPAPPADDGIRRITVQETQELLAKGEAVIIDVRTEPAYKAEHIKNSKSLPANQLLAHMDELPKDKLIVAYCSCPTEHTSGAAVINLKGKGYANAAALLGGFDAWKKAGLPVAASPAN